MSQKEWDEYNGEEESQDEDKDRSLLGELKLMRAARKTSLYPNFTI